MDASREPHGVQNGDKNADVPCKHVDIVQEKPDVPSLHPCCGTYISWGGRRPGPPGGLPWLSQPVGRAGSNNPSDKRGLIIRGGAKL